MATADLRKRVRALILGITGFIIALIFMRVVIDFLDPGADSGFADLIIEITDLFISPMEGLIELSTASEIDQLNVTALLAIFIYFVTGLVLAEIITAFIYDNVNDVILNFVDGLFKLLEFLIFLRIIFDLLQVNQKVGMVKTIYSMTNWAEGAVVDLKILDDRLDISIVLILIFIVILDIVSEGLLKGMLPSDGMEGGFGGSNGSRSGSTNKIQNITNVTAPAAPQPQFQQPQPQKVVSYASLLPQQPVTRKPPQQNITVNIPAPQPVPQVQQAYNMPQPTHNPIPQSMSVNIPQNAEVRSPQDAVKEMDSEPMNVVRKQPSFGQNYTVKSIPSRFRTTTLYGKTPRTTENKSVGGRLKKLFGS